MDGDSFEFDNLRTVANLKAGLEYAIYSDAAPPFKSTTGLCRIVQPHNVPAYLIQGKFVLNPLADRLKATAIAAAKAYYKERERTGFEVILVDQVWPMEARDKPPFMLTEEEYLWFIESLHDD